MGAGGVVSGHVVDDGLLLQDAPLSSRHRELGQFELGRGGFEAALEVIEAHRGEEFERAIGIL